MFNKIFQWEKRKATSSKHLPKQIKIKFSMAEMFSLWIYTMHIWWIDETGSMWSCSFFSSPSVTQLLVTQTSQQGRPHLYTHSFLGSELWGDKLLCLSNSALVLTPASKEILLHTFIYHLAQASRETHGKSNFCSSANYGVLEGPLKSYWI